MAAKVSDYLLSLRAAQPHGKALVEAARPFVCPDGQNRALLSFSAGKDGIALALFLREHFEEVVPFYFYLVPDLPMDLETLDYYERHLFHRPIVRLPSPELIAWLRGYVWQPPRAAAVLAAANLPEIPAADLIVMVRQSEGLHPDCYVADGSRAGENAARARTIRMTGPLRHARKLWWSIWDWNTDDVLDAIDKAGLALPVVYDWQKSSICGLDFQQMALLKKHRPEDFAKVVEWFPLIETEFWRFERAQR